MFLRQKKFVSFKVKDWVLEMIDWFLHFRMHREPGYQKLFLCLHSVLFQESEGRRPQATLEIFGVMFSLQAATVFHTGVCV